MSLNTFIEDDDFDWTAAVSEIDKACSKVGAPAAGMHLSQPQSTQRLKQKTLDSFVREGKGWNLFNNGKQHHSSAECSLREDSNRKHQFSSRKQHQTASEFSLRDNGYQGHQFNIEKQQQKRSELSFVENENQGPCFNHGKQQQKNSEVSFGEPGCPGRVETSRSRDREGHSTGNPEELFRCEVPFDSVAVRSWIYPANVPCRTYQFNITKVALFSNTLVSLPTGLGKTLIAAAVMYNYFRWFPTGKIIFAAPSRPLVVQQIEACHKVVGIPQDMTIDMTGDMTPSVRAEHWQSRRVFFVTPQCLEKDLQSGTCSSRQIVCLVIDEAHRATGNYSYCVIVRQLLAAKINYRLLALTATPGSKQTTIQAVVDNLQISCLEYRNEDDPDVSQYTHNRKIELIEVLMNAESNQAKNLLIEVLQPVVYRLCGFRVFYNREISRLTPFEFIQAREKFRQAPPPAIPQNEYPQVEMYFGLAITLTHIFKLLFTHGMRPAYEMLQQKLQQGVLKRLQGNEKMHHLQRVMKQTIGHGAPSPKLEKVVEIISTHFSGHDPAKTRVIVFTNFRESVKDIMEVLAAKCTDVKAMEFIGQSSGKSSKGQSQKTQQAVLQKFRAGGFNTIVATSIAEEGLDIMEVDLVICFDANISPLRMIQRMGRTGRKRDGRVVVLACEGAEKEGYLAKQNKNKALKKHMVDGGVYSFNFHPSSHMVPHSYRPEVQLVELAIEEFVPRTKRPKAKHNEGIVGGLRSLSGGELQLLEKYRISLPEELWKPSLIAFPQYQVIPTPVHRVKHSYRTSVLIDALRSLQETSAQVTGITQNPGEEKVNTPAEGIVDSLQEPPVEAPRTIVLSCTADHNDTGDIAIESDKGTELLPSTSSYRLNCADDVHVYNLTKINALNEEVTSISQHATPSSTEGTLAPKPVSELEESREVMVKSNEFQQDWATADVDESHPPRSKLVQDVQRFRDVTGAVSHTNTDDQNVQAIVKTKASSSIVCNTAIPQENPHPVLNEPLVEDNTLQQVMSFGSHRCRYSSGIVHTTELGLIVLASPPPFPSGRSIRKRFTTSGGHFEENSGKLLSHEGISPPTIIFKATETQEKSKNLATRGSGLAEVRRNGDVNIVKTSGSLPQVIEACSVLGREQTSGVEADKVSSRLAVIASQGIVPSSPIAEPLSSENVSTPAVLKTPSVCSAGPDDVQRPGNTSMERCVHHQNTPSTPVTTTLESTFPKGDPRSHSKRFATDSKSKKTPLFSFLCRIHGVSPPRGKLLNFSQDCHDSARIDASVSSRSEPPDLPKALACSEIVTTPQGRSQKSPSEEWQIIEDKDSGSVSRHRKLKRLCKAGEKSRRRSETRKFKRLKKVGAEGLCGGESSRLETEGGIFGKNQRKLLVRRFFDEEAEVSEDEESSDQYDSEEDDEEEYEPDGFIDNAGTQHLNGTVDMMAVYRRSLLTQSPADLSVQYGRLLGTSPATCSDGTPMSSEDISVSTSSLVPGPSLVSPVDDLSPARTDSGRRKPVVQQVSRFNQISVGATATGNIFATSLSTVMYEEQRKLELRKRKLSFQPNPDSADLPGPSFRRPKKGDERSLTLEAHSGSQDARELRATSPADLIKQQMNPVVEFEDDVFDGVDLDALEAEAAQTCRIRSQKVMNPNQEVRQKQDLDACSVDVRVQQYGANATKPRLLSRLLKDDNFGGCPSFDLGLAD